MDTYTKSHGKVYAMSDNTAIEFEWSPSTTNHFANLTIINPLYVEHLLRKLITNLMWNVIKIQLPDLFLE
ncbi:MAG: hypothetical protein MRJ93_14560 [Nitrososphaeraceae archaeon]|nr:hypothetical protein [Nitrososphaeraceae archaeon]